MLGVKGSEVQRGAARFWKLYLQGADGPVQTPTMAFQCSR